MSRAETQSAYHKMTLEEYAETAHSQTVPRWSILALPPESYTRTQLCQFSREVLSILALLWGVTQEGAKDQLADKILRRVQFRQMLARQTAASLSQKPRKDLIAIAREAEIYHPWLNRRDLATALIRWREDARKRAKHQMAKSKHEELVRTAAHKGLLIRRENLERYGLDAAGQPEPTIVGVALSRAAQVAPEGFEAAKSLSLPQFLNWIRRKPELAAKLAFIQPGILGDGGAFYWRQVRTALAANAPPPLFDTQHPC